MEFLHKLDELPTVKDAMRLPYDQYFKHAQGILEFKDYCQMGLTESLAKVHDWCVHLKCLSPDDPCVPMARADELHDSMNISRNLMYDWLKVPIQMFLPYLSVGVLVSVVVTKMLNLHTSKWKAVASLCNDTACACVCRTGVCGNDCQEGVANPPKWSGGSHSLEIGPESETVGKLPADVDTVHETQPSAKLISEPAGEVLDPIEEELAYLYFQLPQVDETREHANVITAVCIGLLLILFKVPKFFLHVLSTENYITYDPTIFALIDQFLDTIFAACKPTVCILVGAHFRQALLAPPRCCSNQNKSAEPSTAKPPTRSKSGDLQLTERPGEKRYQSISVDERSA
ncbi:unnamed protein product [Echinostoma caproni]|uniref:Anoctamin n=1 Tax=Echinostoma caproni TaxID=27848 RepID=A0A183APY6_9TREM|nr:unnamed protein product [Echinostoma caproni]